MSKTRPGRSPRPSRSFSLGLAITLACLSTLTACPEPDGASATAEASSPPAAKDETPAASAHPVGKPEPASAPRNPNERPLPAFEGTTVGGGRLALRDLLGSRVVLFFFNPEVAEAAPVAAAVESIAARAGDHNFRVVGIGVGSQTPALARFTSEHGLSFPVIDDSSGSITQLLRLRAPLAILGMDAEGYMSFAMGHFPVGPGLEEMVIGDLETQLRLDTGGTGGDGALYAWPQAPELGVVAMSDGKVLETADLRGRAAIVIFFLHTCPHCHKALEAIEGILDSLPADKRPRLVAVSIQNAPTDIRRSLAELGLDYFDPYLDPSGKATERWGITGGVPVVHVLDAEGRIRHRGQGWSEQRDPGMLRMTVAAVAGARVPMLLDPKGYSGNDVCGTCHQQEYATWRYTKHATAFDTLVTHAADRRTDCVGCHVVGFGEAGGYDFRRQPAHLENVGCESCHGRGGPHLSPGFVPKGDGSSGDTADYAAICSTCHNPTHSLGFDYATFHPRISHDRIASLPDAERAKLLASGGPNRELLPTTADYVGSNACQSCHPAEFETWQASPHARAVATLEAKGKAADADCLRCHTTAWDKPGGFPAGADVASHADLARVGCESCHGPGGAHVGDTTRKVGTILSLGDKCDSCVILKVCGSCHDAANDPGFEFEVEARIEAQRHGTTPSAATRAQQEGS
ncbi:MAG: redoxin family protein [Myxococcales bacterium]|nr:redoxin family protein [Myxococcales bacterium]